VKQKTEERGGQQEDYKRKEQRKREKRRNRGKGRKYESEENTIN